MSSLVPKIAAIGAACFGLTMFRDNLNHVRGETAIHETEMVEHDYLHHTLHSMGDYSGNSTMTGWKHSLFNPVNFHFIKRPYLWAKSMAGLVWDNMIPLGLTFVGLTWGFGGRILGDAAQPGVLRYLYRGLEPVVTHASSAIGQVASAASSVIGPGLSNLWNAIPKITLDARGVLGLAAVGALGMYFAHVFKRELTGENRDSTINYLNPPHH